MLSLEHVYKAYSGLAVMEDFNLELEEGRVHCFFGPSGCGKTTLLSLLSGLAQPDQGAVVLPGGAAGAVVFQEDRLLPWLSVRHNIAYALESRVGIHAALAEADRQAGQAGLGSFLDALPRQLSGGMKRRTAIARALACQADLLFLDEPFKGLDYSLRQDLMKLVLEEKKRLNQTVLLITHDPDEAAFLADRVHVVEGPPLKIVRQLDVPQGIRGGRDGAWLREQLFLQQPSDQH